MAPKMKSKSSTSLVTELMDFSTHGALAQIFILTAIETYTNEVLKSPKPEDDGTAIISKLTWYNIAKEVSQKLREHYKH